MCARLSGPSLKGGVWESRAGGQSHSGGRRKRVWKKQVPQSSKLHIFAPLTNHPDTTEISIMSFLNFVSFSEFSEFE